MVTEGIPVELQLLLPKNADPHHFSLRPSQARMLQEADLVLLANRNLELFLEKNIENQPTKYRALYENPDIDISHGWLSPYYAEISLGALRHYLEKTSGLEGVWNNNLEHSINTLREYDVQWREIMVPHRGKTLWVDSLSFTPFTKHFKLNIQKFTPKALMRLEQTEGTHCILVTHGRNALADKLHKSSPYIHTVTTGLLGTQFTADKTLYFQLMDDLVEKLQGCLN